jgi:hypothetical protein
LIFDFLRALKVKAGSDCKNLQLRGFLVFAWILDLNNFPARLPGIKIFGVIPFRVS